VSRRRLTTIKQRRGRDWRGRSLSGRKENLERLMVYMVYGDPMVHPQPESYWGSGDLAAPIPEITGSRSSHAC
jgi:hypothetical protein